MGKALVVKGTDFSQNKLATVSLFEPIPCENIALSENSISFNAVGETVQLTVVKVPANTTDTVSWRSSNTDVAIVVDGLVTCVGLGEAVITVTCGSESDTCSTALSSMVVNLMSNYDHFAGKMCDVATISDSKAYVPLNNNASGVTFYTGTEFIPNEYKAFYSSSSELENVYGIPIPKGATRVSFSCSNVSIKRVQANVFDSSQPAHVRPSGASYSALAIMSGAKTNQAVTFDLTDHPECNSFTVGFYNYPNTAETPDLSATYTATFE